MLLYGQKVSWYHVSIDKTYYREWYRKPFYGNRIIQEGNKSMEFSVRGIGIIKEADIKIDGLTVIAGSNNSGKTTVGRALYSIVNAVENLEEKQDMDQAVAIVDRILRILNLYRSLLNEYEYVMRDCGEERNSFIISILNLNHMPVREKPDYYIMVLHQFCEAIREDTLLDYLIGDMKKASSEFYEEDEAAFCAEWEKIKPKALAECQKARDFVNSFHDQKRKDFACKIAERTL